LRELNLEDVEPAEATPAEQPTLVELKTFDGLVVKITGMMRNDESWITLEASADPAPAAATPPPAAAPAAEGAAPAATPATPATPAAADPAAEAARINARVGGWRYKIAGFQYDQLTRRMADLLKAPPAA
jgi:pyruvate/2-oxoglutarate dehydrogenase complex dihydrolipoamide acyltransferase (E2) component